MRTLTTIATNPRYEEAAAQASTNTIFVFSVTLACLWSFGAESPGLWILPFWMIGMYVVSITISAPLFALGCKGLLSPWLFSLLDTGITIAATCWVYLAVFATTR